MRQGHNNNPQPSDQVRDTKGQGGKNAPRREKQPQRACTVKCTWTMVEYIKTTIFLVKCLKVEAKCYLDLISFHSALYYRVRHLNIKYQDEIFKTYH